MCIYVCEQRERERAQMGYFNNANLFLIYYCANVIFCIKLTEGEVVGSSQEAEKGGVPW